MFKSIARVLRAVAQAMSTGTRWVFEGGKWVLKAVVAPFGGGGMPALPEPPADLPPAEAKDPAEEVRRLQGPGLAETLVAYARAMPGQRKRFDLSHLPAQDQTFIRSLPLETLVKIARNGSEEAARVIDGGKTRPEAEPTQVKLARLKRKYGRRRRSPAPVYAPAFSAPGM